MILEMVLKSLAMASAAAAEEAISRLRAEIAKRVDGRGQRRNFSSSCQEAT